MTDSETVVLANKMLAWMRDKEIRKTDNIQDNVVVRFSLNTGHTVTQSWRAWDLLREYGRISRNKMVWKIDSYHPIILSNIYGLSVKTPTVEYTCSTPSEQLYCLHICPSKEACGGCPRLVQKTIVSREMHSSKDMTLPKSYFRYRGLIFRYIIGGMQVYDAKNRHWICIAAKSRADLEERSRKIYTVAVTYNDNVVGYLTLKDDER